MVQQVRCSVKRKMEVNNRILNRRVKASDLAVELHRPRQLLLIHRGLQLVDLVLEGVAPLVKAKRKRVQKLNKGLDQVQEPLDL